MSFLLSLIIMAPHFWWKWHEIDAYSTGPFALLLANSLGPLTHLLVPYRSLHSFAPSLAHLLASAFMGEEFMAMN